jgi:hypothetical protein
MTAIVSSPRLPINTWFGDQPVTRSEVLAWEARRARKALHRLGATIPTGDVDALRAALVETKVGLGREEVERHLIREVGWSDRATRVAARASGTRRRLCQVELRVSGCPADRLPAWYMGRAEADDEAAFLAACPDHHSFRLTPDLRQEVWETTGGSPIASRFFFTLDEADTLVTPADPTYPVQMVGAARLADGTLIGGIRHQFRDEGDGLRALLTVEMPWLVGPLATSAHRWHLAAEFSTWIEAAAAGDRRTQSTSANPAGGTALELGEKELNAPLVISGRQSATPREGGQPV